VLKVDGKEVARNTLEHTTPITFPEDETFDIGSDTRTGVAMIEYRYDVPFRFTGKIHKLTFDLEPTPAQSPAKAELREPTRRTVARSSG
jgi:arylsulfatase